VHYDSWDNGAFIVEKPDGMECRFVRASTGLYYHDMAPAGDDSGTALVNTVLESNKTRYTKHANSQATLAHKLQKMIGYPSTHDFLKLMEGNMIPNCPFSRANIITPEAIFGPNVDTLKGKTVHHGEARAHVVGPATYPEGHPLTLSHGHTGVCGHYVCKQTALPCDNLPKH
jgi:hypothetical protein